MCINNKNYKQASSIGIYEDKDISLSPKKLIGILSSDLGEALEKNNEGWIKYNNLQISIKNITYLGKPHPKYKKRGQFSDKLKNSFRINPEDKIILGHYQNSKGERMYVNWKLQKSKVGSSKSSHVYVDDLQNCFSAGGIITRIDKNNNVLTIIPHNQLKTFLKQSDDLQSNLLQQFAKFVFDEGVKWDGKKSIQEMKENNFGQWRQTQWPGWYFEFLASKFFKGKKTVQTENIEKFGKYEPDLFITTPIDQKFHSDNKSDWLLGNDVNAVNDIIKKYGKITYIIASGESISEDNDFKFTKWFKALQSKEFIQGKRKLTKQTTIKEIFLIDIDKHNIDKAKSFQKNMVNSNGNLRNEKIKLKISEFDKETLIK